MMPTRRTRRTDPATSAVRLAALLLASLLLAPMARAQTGRPAAMPAQPPPGPADGSSIVAVVNGAVISRADVDARSRLFAVSTGLPMTKAVLDRLTPQVIRQLVDERLRLQEIERRKIVVADQDIATAIGEVESRNSMPPGTLQRRLAAAGVDMRTLIDQLRVQIGWTRVLRDQLGAQTQVGTAEIAEREQRIKAETGQPEYRVSEIFIPVDDPAHEQGARSFADTVIEQLHAGAPFAVVAAQFSQSQTALQGGDLGWVQPYQLDPEVARLVAEMPPGAVSNPIPVAGGFTIVALRAKRLVGNDPATILKVRETFLPFSTRLDPQNPTEQQRQQLARAKQIGASVHSCDAMEAANRAAGNVRPADPGDVRLETVAPPAFRAMLASLPDGRASQPLVSADGIGVVIVCSRQEKNLGVPASGQIADQIVEERAELASRQLMEDLRRRAVIQMRTGGV